MRGVRHLGRRCRAGRRGSEGDRADGGQVHGETGEDQHSSSCGGGRRVARDSERAEGVDSRAAERVAARGVAAASAAEDPPATEAHQRAPPPQSECAEWECSAGCRRRGEWCASLDVDEQPRERSDTRRAADDAQQVLEALPHTAAGETVPVGRADDQQLLGAQQPTDHDADPAAAAGAHRHRNARRTALLDGERQTGQCDDAQQDECERDRRGRLQFYCIRLRFWSVGCVSGCVQGSRQSLRRTQREGAVGSVALNVLASLSAAAAAATLREQSASAKAAGDLSARARARTAASVAVAQLHSCRQLHRFPHSSGTRRGRALDQEPRSSTLARMYSLCIALLLFYSLLVFLK